MQEPSAAASIPRDASPSAALPPDLIDPDRLGGAPLALLGALHAVRAAFAAEGLDPADVAERVERLTEQMHLAGLPSQVPLNQFFTGALYAREILIPAGSFAIGEIQLMPHISVIARGEISMLGECGGIVRIRAPYTCVSRPGARKCGYAHTDTVWTTVHDVSALGRDPASIPTAELERFLVARSRAELAARAPQLELLG